MPRLSINVNKVATLRNSRGGTEPCPIAAALDCQGYGAQGITVHPRPDERHIRRTDVLSLSKKLSVDLNVEGYPSEDYIHLIHEIRPQQVTLVPDPPHVLTSEVGWDLSKKASFLQKIIPRFKQKGIRVSIFLDPDLKQLSYLKETDTDCVEFHTGHYAKIYPQDKKKAVAPYVRVAKKVQSLGLRVHVGHDLNLKNIAYLISSLPICHELSVGHAFISDALRFGLSNTVALYLRAIRDAIPSV
ncbi:MAG: pyridoxine 5'-phosphate synthase [Cytophagales bacterium]|nr:pyridoxine 5'-phosphate synthase [Cytophagales bacterium]